MLSLSEWIGVASFVMGVAASAIGWSVWAVWWLSKQFSQTRRLITQETQNVQARIESKLDYHEKHDDQRFNAITNDLWAIRVRNASRDNDIITEARDNGK